MLTGYFAKQRDYIALGLTPVAICLFTPDWYKGAKYIALAPSKSILFDYKYDNKYKGDKEHYIERYNKEILGKLDYKEVVKELESLTKTSSDKIVLLCYEKPNDFCHRHLVSKWFIENKIECIEVNTNKDNYEMLEKLV